VRRTSDTAQLAQLAEIRKVQRTAREIEAARSTTALADAETGLQRETDALIELENEWQRSMGSAGLATGIAGLWAAAVLHQETVVRSAERAVDEARRKARAATASWRTSLLQHDLACDVLRDARRAMMRRRLEAALTSAADRHVAAWGRRA
jgi:hypothetical protein